VYESNDYTADGTMADYVAGVLQVPYVFILEVFGVLGDLPNCFQQFNPDAAAYSQVLRDNVKLFRVLVHGILGDAYSVEENVP
jgi:hypothetical protein